MYILKVDPSKPEHKKIRIAANALRHGLLVAFPTETVYGLGANALDRFAVNKIFEAKGRPTSDPLIVHLADKTWLPRVTSHTSPIVDSLAEAFWPGPLTLILPKRNEIPDLVTAGRNTVAVRVPSHPIALALIKEAGVLVAAPSANRFGYTSPTKASHVLSDLSEQIDVLLDGGETLIGIESTVLDITGSKPVILRPGGVTCEQLSRIIGDVSVQNLTSSEEILQKSPGLMLKHYSPRANLIFVIDSLKERALAYLRQIAEEEINAGRSVGVLMVEEDLDVFIGLPVQVASLGTKNDMLGVAHNLYGGLRELDSRNVEIILARDLGDRGLGLALRDRLKRAATKTIWRTESN